jgi:quinol monooxygenase YgiN
MPVVRISLGRFDAASYDAVRKLLDDSQKTLVPAIRALKGNRAYYVGIDPENNVMSNVSVWDTRADAEQMVTLKPMLELAKVFC